MKTADEWRTGNWGQDYFARRAPYADQYALPSTGDPDPAEPPMLCAECGSECEHDACDDLWRCRACDLPHERTGEPIFGKNEPVPYKETWPNPYDECPYCGARRVRVNKKYYEPSVRCDACKMGASASDWGLPVALLGHPDGRATS